MLNVDAVNITDICSNIKRVYLAYNSCYWTRLLWIFGKNQLIHVQDGPLSSAQKVASHNQPMVLGRTRYCSKSSQ